MADEQLGDSYRSTPSEYVRLEADLAAESLTESVWISRPARMLRPFVLVIEANAELRERAATKLRFAVLASGEPAFRVTTAENARAAIRVVETEEVDVIVCGNPGTSDAALNLHEILHHDVRFSRGARIRIASGTDSVAAALMREPRQARLVAEVLADLADGVNGRAPPQ